MKNDVVFLTVTRRKTWRRDVYSGLSQGSKISGFCWRDLQSLESRWSLDSGESMEFLN